MEVYEKYLKGTYRAVGLISWGFHFGPKNDLFWSHYSGVTDETFIKSFSSISTLVRNSAEWLRMALI